MPEGHHPSFLGRWHWSAEVHPPLPLRRRGRHSAALERRRLSRTQPSHVPSRQPSPGSRLPSPPAPPPPPHSTTCCITSLSGAQLHPPADTVREAHRAGLRCLRLLSCAGLADDAVGASSTSTTADVRCCPPPLPLMPTADVRCCPQPCCALSGCRKKMTTPCTFTAQSPAALAWLATRARSHSCQPARRLGCQAPEREARGSRRSIIRKRRYAMLLSKQHSHTVGPPRPAYSSTGRTRKPRRGDGGCTPPPGYTLTDDNKRNTDSDTYLMSLL
jgi:hypothetical protein